MRHRALTAVLRAREPGAPATRKAQTATASRSGRGQTLVEFALVIPIFMAMLIALVEFTFIFNAILATNYASRDAALLAAEAGSDLGADCAILKAVEADIGAPADRSQIQAVEIFEATAAGAQTGSPTVYSRTGTYGCTLPDGTAISLPYTRTANDYAMSDRCNVLVGCPGSPHLDHVGVRVTYRHTWRTPFGSSFGPFLDVVKANSMRMEPVL
jgi:Flp pilus assembly protein TadG